MLIPKLGKVFLYASGNLYTSVHLPQGNEIFYQPQTIVKIRAKPAYRFPLYPHAYLKAHLKNFQSAASTPQTSSKQA